MTTSIPLGLYIHWPYCARICPYCDFNVFKARSTHDDLVEAICTDMAAWRALTGARALTSIHFGGGTPSLLTPSQLGRMVDTAEQLWGFEPDVEIGLEGNPNDHAGFAGLAKAGANRISLGVQSFDNDALKMLGRDHDSLTARQAIDAAQAAFPRVSFDMIYALENQSVDDWSRELKRALAYGTEHLSLYQLTIEPGTAFDRRVARGEMTAPDSDMGADLYAVTQEVCARAGLEPYEISNHARDDAARSVHNSLYWTGGDWIGVGPGAHGRLGSHSAGGRLASEAARKPANYITQVTQAGRGFAGATLPAEDEAVERVLMGLRIKEGLARKSLMALTGFDIQADTAARYAEQGLVTLTGARVALTPAGRPFGDRIAADLAPDA